MDQLHNPQASDTPRVFSIVIEGYISGDGIKTAYGLDGIEEAPALGYMKMVEDRMRESIKYNWDTCPGCGLPWEAHDEGDPEDE